MKTFLLYWNPHFSSYTPERFLNDFKFPEGKDILTDEDNWDRSPSFFNWSVLEHEKAHKGDRFIFVRVGFEKPTGMVGVGTFTSEPYVDRDWSGQGRVVYYLDMRWESVVNPTSDSILKTASLIEAIPEVVWSRGKSGVEVAPEIAVKIEALWQKHIEAIK